MDLKRKINNYFEKKEKKRKIYYCIKKESFWCEVDKEINKLNIDNSWGIDRKIWHYMNNTNLVPKCDICGINNCKWQSYKHDYGCCSLSCNGVKKMKVISKKLGGNPFEMESIKNKSKQTLIDKYGVDNISKLDFIKNKKEQTMLKNYGRKNNTGEHGEIIKMHMRNKYGVDNPAHMPEVADKIFNNRFKKRHLLITPSGKKIYLQGYEVYGYNILLDEGYKEEDILYKKVDMPKIIYNFNGFEKRYYPDFFIKNKNIVVEVKCKYTYEVDKQKNDEKFIATKNMGYEHRLLLIK